MRRSKQTLKDTIALDVATYRSSAKKSYNHLNELEADIAKTQNILQNTPEIIEKLDRDFEENVSLNKTDIVFLFIATALQCLRQYVLSNDAFRLTAKEGDTLIGKVVPKSWQDILLSSVPYDAIKREDEFKLLGESTGLSGFTHRYRTLGHDPIFGWIFGTANILTDSLTKSDIITNYSVQNMKIMGHYEGGVMQMFNDSVETVQSDKYLLPTAVARQALHFGSDYFTKQGLPIPIIPTVNNDFSKYLVSQQIDMYSVMRSATVAIFINSIIECIHSLFYNENKDINREIYSVRTKKIVLYSNVIASVSNIVFVAVNSAMGNQNALKKLDVGGILVTLYKIFTTPAYIAQIKMEFIANQFSQILLEK